jgi:hypothetical protein
VTNQIPNLAGVVVKDDVFRKGPADYIAWARIANYLHEHANGWEFNLQPAPGGGHVWKAPDGTGYLVGYFTGPEDQATPDFPYAITDNRNAPLPMERISARALSDAHRRGFCAAAAFTFGLGYELWAKEEVAAASSTGDAEPAPSKPPSKPAPQGQPPLAADEMPADKDSISIILQAIKELEPAARQQILDAFSAEFKVPKGTRLSTFISTVAHVGFFQRALAEG